MTSLTRCRGGEQPDIAEFEELPAVVMLGVAGLAAFVPARRALRVDPMTALSHE